MGAGPRVLVVEGCPNTAKSCRQLLDLWGHDAVAGRDGRDALPAALAFKPDVVLLDLGLPGLGGFGVAARLRSAGLEDVVTVAVTGHGRDRRAAAAAGIDHVLVEPACPNERDRLPAALRRRLRAAGDGYQRKVRGANVIGVKLFLTCGDPSAEAGTPWRPRSPPSASPSAGTNSRGGRGRRS